MPNFLYAIIAALLFASLPSAAEEGEFAKAPISKLFFKYDTYLDLATKGEPGFVPRYRVFSQRDNVEEIRFEFSFGGETIRFSANSDGIINFRPTRAMLEADPEVTLDQPQDTMGATVLIQILEPAQKAYDLHALHDRVHRAWGQAKKMGGFMAMLAPRHSNLTAVFDDTCPSPVWSISKDGKEIAGGTADKQVLIALKEKHIRKADKLAFSCAPAFFHL